MAIEMNEFLLILSLSVRNDRSIAIEISVAIAVAIAFGVISGALMTAHMGSGKEE